MSEETVRLKIKRQDGPEGASYWQEFEVPKKASANVIFLSAGYPETSGDA